MLLSAFQALLIGIFYGYIALRTYSGSFTADNVVAIVGIIPVLIPAITQLSSIPMMTTTWAKNISYLKKIKEYDSDRYFGTLPVEKEPITTMKSNSGMSALNTLVPTPMHLEMYQ